MHSLLDRSTILAGLVDELRPLLPSLGGALGDICAGVGHNEAAEQALETAFMIRAAAEMLELETLAEAGSLVEELVGLLQGAPPTMLRDALPIVQGLLAVLEQATDGLLNPAAQPLAALEAARTGLQRLRLAREKGKAESDRVGLDLEAMLGTLPSTSRQDVPTWAAPAATPPASAWSALEAVASGQPAPGDPLTRERPPQPAAPIPSDMSALLERFAELSPEPALPAPVATSAPAPVAPLFLAAPPAVPDTVPDEAWTAALANGSPAGETAPAYQPSIQVQDGDYSWWQSSPAAAADRTPAPAPERAEPMTAPRANAVPAPVATPPDANVSPATLWAASQMPEPPITPAAPPLETPRTPLAIPAAASQTSRSPSAAAPVSNPPSWVAPPVSVPTPVVTAPATPPAPPVEKAGLFSRFLKGLRATTPQATPVPTTTERPTSTRQAAPMAEAAPAVRLAPVPPAAPVVAVASAAPAAPRPVESPAPVSPASSWSTTPPMVVPAPPTRIPANDIPAAPTVVVPPITPSAPRPASPAPAQVRSVAEVVAVPVPAVVVLPAPRVEPAPAAPARPPVVELPEALRSMPEVDAEILEVFMEEAAEVLGAMHEELTAVEADPTNGRAAAELRRACHTLKGAANVVGFPSIGLACKSMEDLLDNLAEANLTPDPIVLHFLNVSYQTVELLVASPAEPGLLSIVAELVAEGSALSLRIGAEPTSDAASTTPAEAAAWSEAVDNFLADGELARPAAQPTALPDFSTETVTAFSEFQPTPTTEAGAKPASSFASLWEAALAASEPDSVHETESTMAVNQGQNQELVAIFAQEAEEHLAALSAAALQLDAAPNDAAALAEARRTLHTLKGAAGALDLEVIGGICHEAETQLEQAGSPGIAQTLFDTSESLEQVIRSLANTGQEAAVSSPALLDLPEAQLLTPVLDAVAAAAESTVDRASAIVEAPAPLTPSIAAPRVPPVELVAPLAAAASEPIASTVAETETLGDADDAPVTGGAVRVELARVDDLLNLVGEVVITRFGLEQRLERVVRSADELRHTVARLRRVAQYLEDRYEVAELLRATPEEPRYGDFDELEMDRYTELHRVSREVGELAADSEATSDELDLALKELDGLVARQAHLGSDLQDRLMAVRLVPLSSLVTRLQLAARNIALRQGKEIEFTIAGSETELDKRVVEELGDVLIHLVRNAVDHGLERPAEREQAGKPARGTLSLRAYREGNEVALELGDDGSGIDLQRLRQKAEALRLVEPGQELDQQELMNLIFQPGVSTSATITDLSGRGVGLDAVRAAVTRLKGSLEVSSEPGQGTIFTVRLPVVLAVLQAMVVKAGDQTYAIPMAALQKVIKSTFQPAAILGATPVVEIDGEAYPYLDLATTLGQTAPRRAGEETPLLVVRTGDRRVALAVGELLGQQEVVVKPLGPHLRVVRGVLGATIMGNAEVVLVLNTTELLTPRLLVVSGRTPPRAPESRPAVDLPLTALVVDDSISVRKVLARALERDGWEVRQARDGVNALEVLQDYRPSVVLMDIEMPRMDGFELAAILREVDDYGNPPVVMITSRGGDKHRQRAEELGVAGYVVKPYQEADLLATLRQVVLAGRRG